MSDIHTALQMDALPGTDTTTGNTANATRNGQLPHTAQSGGVEVLDVGRLRPTRAVPESAFDEEEDDRINTTAKGFGIDDGLLEDRIGGGSNGARHPENAPRRPSFMFPEYEDGNGNGNGNGSGNGFVDINGVRTAVPDLNAYQHKKTLAQGMMDLALLSANANQLRYVLESFQRHPYYYPSLVFITLSIIFQVAVGVGLILNGRYNIRNKMDRCRANRINNYTVIGIFIVTVVNVFISAFGVATREPAPTV